MHRIPNRLDCGSRRSCSFLPLLFLLVSLTTKLHAQNLTSIAEVLPDAPSSTISSKLTLSAQSTDGTPRSRGDQQVPPITMKPQSALQKFGAATQSSFSYPSVLFAAAGAGISLGTNYYPEFHKGGAGYGRYLWHAFADQTTNAYMTEFVLPVLLHQDSRYYRQGYGSLWKRSVYALSRLVVTRSDQGVEEFNTSEILGTGMAASISSTFYPERERTFSVVGSRWAANAGGDALGLLSKEFSPEIGSALGNVVHLRRHAKSKTVDTLAPEQEDHS